MRRLLPIVCVLFVLEGALYSALPPLLPHYAHALALSKTMAGVLTAAYTVGLLPGAVVSGRLSTRIGLRLTVIAGLILLGASSLVFGFGKGIWVLVGSRGAQGVACGLVWGGGLGWLARATPDTQRGRSIGLAFGAGTVGTLIGPVLGSLALAVGTREVFGLVGLAAAVLVLGVLGLAAPALGGEAGRSLLLAYRSATLRLPIWLVTVPAVSFGLLGVLIPLRLTALGASRGTVALTFLLAAAAGAAVGPLAGRVSDRRGRLLPITGGLLVCVPCLASLPLVSATALVAGLTVILMGGGVALAIAPAVALVTDRGDRALIGAAVPSVILISVALGETIGSAGGAALAQATSEAAPFVTLAVIDTITLLLLVTRYGGRMGTAVSAAAT